MPDYLWPILDPALDPRNDPRVIHGGCDPEDLDLVSEEMMDWGLNYDEDPLYDYPECYLRARDMVIEGRIGPMEMIPMARRFMERQREWARIMAEMAEEHEQRLEERSAADATLRAGGAPPRTDAPGPEDKEDGGE